MSSSLPWQIMFIEGAVVLSLMLIAHGLRQRHSLAPYFAVMGAITLLSWWAGLMLQQPDPSIFTRASVATLIPSLFTGLFLIYALDGPKAGRVLLFSMMILALASPLFGFLFLGNSTPNDLTQGLIDANSHWRSAISGSLTMLVDFLLLGGLWELQRRSLPAFLLPLGFVIVLVITGAADLFVYRLLLEILNGQQPAFPATLLLQQRLLISSIYALVLLPYVMYQLRRIPDDFNKRPLLAVLQQEKQLRDEIREIREEMARKHTLEKSLNERSALFHSLFELSPAGILLCDLQGRIQEANPAARALLTPRKEGETIHHLEQLLPDEVLAHLKQGMDENKQSQPVLHEIGEHEYAITAVHIQLAQEQPGMALLLQDLSERQQMEDELIRHDRLESLSILAGGIAHDFNNLLTGILAGLSLARMQLAEAEPIESMKTLDHVEEQAKLASRLTHQLLTFSKGGEPALNTLSLQGFLEDSARFGLRGSSVQADFELENELWPVRADQGQLHQVVNNLVINATQAMDNKGRLHVRAYNRLLTQPYKTLPAGRYVCIEVQDEGPGIPDELKDRVFDPFFTTKKSGHGLGLASSFSILKRHHGLLEVENVQEGGACFRLFVPPGNPEEAPQVRTISVAQYQARVLIMDDQDTILKLLTRMLEKIGLEISCARTGEEAIILYQQALSSGHKYDLVILDLTVPDGMGGQECMRNLMELDPEVRAVVSSGYSDDPVMARYNQYGFVDRLAKPYTIGEVWAMITRVLPEHAQREN